ncbi:RAD52 motif-containing protein 1 [Camelus dromedarius]|uniref:RAD52 motif-containing protein 1 n=1 Tax=Camelus dromedarius TaxID=9838 RepID=A0A5N4D122_CAMDR|nr:RAD52 motif-containing protein 1 [Camelus dromedarius]
MAEMVPFAVPTESDKTLLVWELSSGPTTQALQVRLGTRHKMFQPNALALSSSRCQELANYYFGFNGWSKRIIKKQSLKFCALEVMLTSYEARSPGAGITEEPLDKLEEENSKMAVVYRPCEEVTGARTEEEVRDLIQVCGDKNSRGTQPMSP